MKKKRLLQPLSAGRGTWLVLLAIVLLCSPGPLLGSDSRRVIEESQTLRKRMQVLSENEYYLDAFAVSIERLKLLVPPTDTNRDEFVDAMTDMVLQTMLAGKLTLADDLAHVLLKEAGEHLGSRDVRTAAAWRIYSGVARGTRSTSESWFALDEARCILESIGETESYEYAKWLWAAGNWYRWPNVTNSLAYIQRAMELRDELITEPSSERADVTAWVGWTLLHLGRHDEARVCLERARQMYLTLGLTDDTTLGTVEAAFGDLAALKGDWPLAEEQYRKAAHMFEAGWAKRGVTSKNLPLHGYNLIAFAQVQQGKHEEAWRSLEKYRAGQAMRASVGAANWRVRSDRDYDAIRAMYDGLLHNRASAQAAAEAPNVRPETWRALMDQLELTAQLGRAETNYVLKHPLPEVSLERLRSRLDKRTAYIGWLDAFFADDLSKSTGPFLRSRWLYVVRRDEPIKWTPVYQNTNRDADEAMRTSGRGFYSIMTRAASWRERLDEDPDLDRHLKDVHKSTFGPNSLELPGITRLVAEVACYDGWIQTDPLIDAQGRYLVERYSVSYSPSAAIYVALSESPRAHRKKTAVLAIGDPTFAPLAPSPSPEERPQSRIDEVILRGSVNRDADALDKLPRLPYSGRELDRVSALFSDSRVLRGEEASEAVVNRIAAKGELSRFDIVHIASHALVDRSPERCAIALARTNLDSSGSNDGLVDTPEIRMGWKLDAQLVTLSACQTTGVAFPRGEPIGFAQALFQAGARCVLLSFWKVDDEATSVLMSRFYENVAAYGKNKKPVSYSDSLAEAKNWLRTYTDDKGARPFAHPVYWSGFVLIGDAD